MSRTCVAVSPHLDDAAFSVGATLAHLVSTGWSVTVLTVFTASVPEPTGFALACQTDKGLGADVDYMAVRRAEDLAAADVLGVGTVHADEREAPHRGYGSAPALFAGVRDDDPLDLAALAAWLAPLLAPADLVLAPQALGAHVDHQQVVEAVRRCDVDERAGWWRDTPYVLREAPGPPSPRLPGGLVEQPVEVAAHLLAKVDACSRYATQIGFQFGDAERMRDALHDLADAEGRRLGAAQAAEVLAGPPGLVASLGL